MRVHETLDAGGQVNPIERSGGKVPHHPGRLDLNPVNPAAVT